MYCLVKSCCTLCHVVKSEIWTEAVLPEIMWIDKWLPCLLEALILWLSRHVLTLFHKIQQNVVIKKSLTSSAYYSWQRKYRHEYSQSIPCKCTGCPIRKILFKYHKSNINRIKRLLTWHESPLGRSLVPQQHTTLSWAPNHATLQSKTHL